MERSSKPKPIPPNTSPFKSAIVVNLGCPKNLVETEKVCHQLTLNGISIVSENDPFDAVFINSCCFLKTSRVETLELIAKYYPDSTLTLVVFGCYATRYTQELKKNFPRILIIAEQDSCKGIQRYFFSSKAPSVYSRQLSNPYTAYLKIAEGCDRACSFCLIPSIKGSFASFPLTSLIGEVEKLCERYPLQELVIVAQDSSSYGKDLKPPQANNLISLLCQIDKASLVPWIRILYLFPSLDFSFLNDLFSIPTVLPYLDMPLQHIDPEILSLMNRPTNIDTTLNQLELLKNKHQDMIFRSTFIVGFPGESPLQFKKLYDFVRAFKYQRAGFFAYSDEEDAPSFSLSNKVPSVEAEIRLKSIYELQNQISLEYHQDLVGKTQSVLIESWNGVSKKLRGRSTWDAPDIDYTVSIACSSPRDAHWLGQVVPVQISGFNELELKGTILE